MNHPITLLDLSTARRDDLLREAADRDRRPPRPGVSPAGNTERRRHRRARLRALPLLGRFAPSTGPEVAS